MVEKVFTRITEYGSEEYTIKCEKCGKVLGRMFVAGSSYQFIPGNDCEHYKIVPVGNACFEDPDISTVCRDVDELKERAVEVFFDGTTVWLIVPL